ncbi:MAG TPA: hypothetical protein VF226_13680 [Hyphomicrobiaceae bacterium]
MTISIHDDVLDKGPNEIKTNATTVTICAGAPTTLSDATTNLGTGTGKKLADVTVDSSDWSIADGSPDGRTLTFTQQTGVTVDVSGDADHLAVVDASRLLLVIPLSATVAVTSGNTMTINSFTYRIPDPVAA